MTLGGSIFLLALGAILAFAVGTTQVGTIHLDIIGYILMAAGILGLFLSMTVLSSRRRGVGRDTTVIERRDDIL